MAEIIGADGVADRPADIVRMQQQADIRILHGLVTARRNEIEVLLAAVNLGGDSEAVGAVAGQIAGRKFGYDAIPGPWRAILHDHDKLLSLADDLYAMRPIDV